MCVCVRACVCVCVCVCVMYMYGGFFLQRLLSFFCTPIGSPLSFRAIPVLKVVTLDLRLFAVKVHVSCIYTCTLCMYTIAHSSVLLPANTCYYPRIFYLLIYYFFTLSLSLSLSPSCSLPCSVFICCKAEAEKTSRGHSKPGELLEKAADQIMACFRVCVSDM